MKLILLIILNLFLYHHSSAQSFNNWKNYSDLKKAQSIAVSPDGIWSATTGGAFFYNFSDDSFREFRKSDGLNGNLLTAVAVDNDNKIWFGGIDGIIDVYDPSTNTFKIIMDIFNYEKSNKRINNIKVSGDTIIISTDFGISLIDSKNYIFYDTFSKLGSFLADTKINNTYYNGLFYVAAQTGVAIQKPNSKNLAAPESWDVFDGSSGLPSANVNKVIPFSNTVLAATQSGLSVLRGNRWEDFLPQFNGQNIKDIITENNNLFILSGNSIYSFNGSEVNNLWNSNIELHQIIFTNLLGIAAASDNGIFSLSNNTPVYYFPNCPQGNQFPNIAVDNSGTIWVGTGRDGAGVGFYSFDGETWTNYNTSTNPELIQNDYLYPYAAPDNTIFVGQWGQGFVRIKDNKINVFNASNTDIEGIEKDPDFLVITGFDTDSRNNTWIMNFGAANNKVLSMITPDSTWYHFSVPAENNVFLEDHHGLVVDQNDTKWYYVLDGDRAGLFYFNENRTYNNSDDDISGYINRNNGLNDNVINSLAVDRRGDLWIGTTIGVNIIQNTNSVLTNSSQLRINSVFTLRQQSINCIAVDPLNNKWVGTNQGLLYVNSDGTSLIESFNVSNSALLSDQIRSVAIDENNGVVYVGTDNGLTLFKTEAIEPKESFEELTFFPSPFVLTGDDKLLTIEGLIRDTDIKILTVTGKLVTEFSSPGGRVASWDGRNNNGDYVNSGIYIIVAYDKEGNSVTSGKVAVLRD